MSDSPPSGHQVSEFSPADAPSRRLGSCRFLALALGILVLLAAYPVYRFNQQVERVSCGLRLRDLQLAVIRYAREKGHYPYADGDWEATMELLLEGGYLGVAPVCPQHGGPGGYAGFKAPYGRDPMSHVVIAWELQGHGREGRAVLYADANVVFHDEVSFEEAMAGHDRRAAWLRAQRAKTRASERAPPR